MRILDGKDKSTPLSAAHGGCSFPDRKQPAASGRQAADRAGIHAKIQCQPDYGFQGPERIKGRGSDYPLSK